MNESITAKICYNAEADEAAIIIKGLKSKDNPIYAGLLALVGSIAGVAETPDVEITGLQPVNDKPEEDIMEKAENIIANEENKPDMSNENLKLTGKGPYYFDIPKDMSWSKLKNSMTESGIKIFYDPKPLVCFHVLKSSEAETLLNKGFIRKDVSAENTSKSE